MKMIVAVDDGWGIGYRNGLLVRIPEDMRYFRKLTMGNVVVMGRKTFDSLPNKQPLKGRRNIVLSRSKIDGVDCCNSVKELLSELKDESRDVFVIGGGEIYKLLFPYCDYAYVTKISGRYPCDTWVENLDKNGSWIKVSESFGGAYNGVEYCGVYSGVEYCFTEYKRKLQLFSRSKDD